MTLRWNSSVGIATGYDLDSQGIGVRFLAGAADFYLLHSVYTGSEVHSASYRMSTGDPKAAMA
jgi:hypothetical protein